MLPTTYSLHNRVLTLLATISHKLGEVKAAHLSSLNLLKRKLPLLS